MFLHFPTSTHRTSILILSSLAPVANGAGLNLRCRVLNSNPTFMSPFLAGRGRAPRNAAHPAMARTRTQEMEVLAEKRPCHRADNQLEYVFRSYSIINVISLDQLKQSRILIHQPLRSRYTYLGLSPLGVCHSAPSCDKQQSLEISRLSLFFSALGVFLLSLPCLRCYAVFRLGHWMSSKWSCPLFRIFST